MDTRLMWEVVDILRDAQMTCEHNATLAINDSVRYDYELRASCYEFALTLVTHALHGNTAEINRYKPIVNK